MSGLPSLIASCRGKAHTVRVASSLIMCYRPVNWVLTWWCIVPRGVLYPDRGRAEGTKVHMLTLNGQVMLPKGIQSCKLHRARTEVSLHMSVYNRRGNSACFGMCGNG